MESLTEEQLKIIEEKRKNALKRKAEKFVTSTVTVKTISTSISNNNCHASMRETWDSKDKSKVHMSKNSLSVPNVNSVWSPSKFSVSKEKSDKSSHFSYTRFTADNFYQSSKPNAMMATCQLISYSRFDVDVKYNERIIQCFKQVKSSLYDVNKRKWSFHINDYATLAKLMESFSNEVSFVGLPKFILDTFLNPKPDPFISDEELSKIDSALMSQVMPFQKEGIRFGISKGGRCLLADDMGLGKTIQALGIAHYYRMDWPMLIVCPSSMRYEWSASIQRWLSSVQCFDVKVLNTGKDSVGDARIVITSYDLLSRHQKILSKENFGLVIMDESHFLKNFKTARTKAALEFCRKSKRVLLLSGTPALSRPSELYTQIRAIVSKSFTNFHDYGLRYCAAKKNAWCWDYNGSSNTIELQLLLEKRFMIRRMKSEVVEQLPSKMREVVILNPDSIHGNNSAMKSCVKSLTQPGLKGMDWRGALLQYFSKTGEAKLSAVKEYLNDLLECGKKIICFAHHQVVINGICDLLEDNEVRYIKIDGAVSSEKRKQLCDTFQYEENVMVAVLSITAANSGITLTAAHQVIFAELFWNPGVLTQAEDRAHRLGQKDSVLVRYLVARNTADDYLWPLIQSKLSVLNQVGLSKDNFLDTETTEIHNKQQVTIRDYFVELSIKDDSMINCSQEQGASSTDNSIDLNEMLVEEEDELAELDLDFLIESQCKKQCLNENRVE